MGNRTKFSSLAAAVIGTSLLAGTAHAGFVNPNLILPGDNQIHDASRTYIVKPAGNQNDVGRPATELDVGDVLRGTINFTTVNSVSPLSQGTEFTAVFDVKVLTKVPTTGGLPAAYTFTFGPDAAFGTYAGDAFNWASFLPGSMAILFDNKTGFKNGDPIASQFTGSGVAGAEASIATAETGTGFWALGFTGAGGTAAAGEMWSSTTPGDNLLPASLVVNTSTQIQAGGVSATTDLALNIIAIGDGPTNVIPVTYDASIAGKGPADFIGHVAINGKKNIAASPFLVSGDGDFEFTTSTVPEPASLGVLGLGSLVMLRRRRSR